MKRILNYKSFDNHDFHLTKTDRAAFEFMIKNNCNACCTGKRSFILDKKSKSELINELENRCDELSCQLEKIKNVERSERSIIALCALQTNIDLHKKDMEILNTCDSDTIIVFGSLYLVAV